MPVRTPQPESGSHCRLTAEAVVLAARPDGSVDLEFAPSAGCAGCAGACLWKRLQAARLERLRPPFALAPGTAVTVELPAERLLGVSMLLHGLPLAAILVGAAAGSLIAGSDLGTLAGVALALAAVSVATRRLRGRLEAATLARLIVTPKP
jgi:positive regulator of sigma E activity